MIKKLFDALSNPIKVERVVQYKVVEVETPRTPLQGGDSEEMRASIATLPSHPGFQFLMKKLALQNAALKSKLHFERHTTLDDVNFLQAGVYWSAWLENEVKRTTVKVSAQKLDPMEEERKAFEELDRQIERVGMEQ